MAATRVAARVSAVLYQEGRGCSRDAPSRLRALSATSIAEGLGVTQDLAQARALYTQGCDGGHAGGCSNLGALYTQGCDGGHALWLHESRLPLC